MTSNNAREATIDTYAPDDYGSTVGFNQHWTRRAIALLRRVASNPMITQAHGDWGFLDDNGHGSVCANQVLIEMLDNVRASSDREEQTELIDYILPVTSEQIILWNDDHSMTFEDIANQIEAIANRAT